MRMWMLKPELMCRQHLLGEHRELHCLLGSLEGKRVWAERLTKLGFLEPQNLDWRHREIVTEMQRRGYNHKTPLSVPFTLKLPRGEVDIKKSIADLKERCAECRRRIENGSK